MIKSLTIVAFALILGGCSHLNAVKEYLIKTETTVYIPDDKFFNCPRVVLPDPETLTKIQSADLIGQLATTNDQCANNMDGIKKDLTDAKAKLEKK